MKRPEMALNKMAGLLEADAAEARSQLAQLGVSGDKIWAVLAQSSQFVREVSYIPDFISDENGIQTVARDGRAVVINWPFISFIEINGRSGSSTDPSFRYFRNYGLPYRVISFAVDWIDGIFLSSIEDRKLLEKTSSAAACRITKKETTVIRKSMRTTVNGTTALQFGRGYDRAVDPCKTELRWSSSGAIEISSSFMLDMDGNGVYSRVFNFINKSSVKIDGKQLQLPF